MALCKKCLSDLLDLDTHILALLNNVWLCQFILNSKLSSILDTNICEYYKWVCFGRYHLFACICIRDATDLKLKVNWKHNMMTIAMLICTLSTELQISMGRIWT